ncbi:hypothetical protein ACWGOQ_0020565 [Aquimarina sp. M1]
MTKIELLVETLKKKPKQLFLIDGLGALLTLFFLIAMSTIFQEYIGMPETALYFLAMIALIYTVYSFSCYYLLNPRNWKPLLKIIAFANLVYCFLTIGCTYHFYQSLTTLGLFYFILEILLVLVLIYLEFITATSYNKITN